MSVKVWDSSFQPQAPGVCVEMEVSALILSPVWSEELREFPLSGGGKDTRDTALP